MYCDIICNLYLTVQTTRLTGAVLCRTSEVFNQPHMLHNCVIHMHNPDILKCLYCAVLCPNCMPLLWTQLNNIICHKCVIFCNGKKICRTCAVICRTYLILHMYTIATKIYTIATYFCVPIVWFYVAHVLPLLWKFCVTYVKIWCPICAVLCHFCDVIPA